MVIGLEKMESLLLLKHKIFLTFDIDWANDEMVYSLIDLCLQYGVKATFFATHASDTLSKLAEYPEHFEIGVHPNFLPGSTQGSTEEEVFAYCKALVPKIYSVRMHCVYQYGRLYDGFNKYFNSCLVDSSIFIPGVETVSSFKFYTLCGELVRVPFVWVDDYGVLRNRKFSPIPMLNYHGLIPFPIYYQI